MADRNQNPYESPEVLAEQSPEAPASRPMFVRGVEYAIAILLVVALIWVVQVFVIRGTFLW